MTNDVIRMAAAVYMDTSTLMKNTNLINFLYQIEEKPQLIIPGCVHERLVKMSEEDSDRGRQARDTLELTDELYRTYFHVEQTVETSPLTFFLTKAEEKRYGLPILVLTQSAEMAHALEIRHAAGCKVTVKRLTAGGCPVNFDPDRLPAKITALSDRTNASAVLKMLIGS